MTWKHPRPMAALAGIALAVTLLSGGPVRAQVLGALPFGVHFDLEACFEGDDDACARAAMEMGHGGWEAYLLEEDAPAGLSDDARAIHRQLRCAASHGGDCTLLGDEALEGGDRFRAAMLYLDACDLSDDTACDRFDGVVLAFEAIDDFKSNFTGHDLGTYGLADGTPADVKTIKKIASRCDGKKGSLDDCVTLARTYNNPRSVAGRSQVESGMEVACSKHGSAAACALVSGKGLAHGSYTSRNYDGYACDGGEDAGCGQLTAAYESGQAAVSQDACRGIRNGEGGNPLACIEAHTMHTFGVGAEKNEVLGGGGGLGLYREGPGKVNEALFSGGVKEFVQFNVFLETVVVGVRIEQQQLFQEHPAMPLDHVTAVYAVFGGRSDD